jgi:hypothetical protein
MYHEQQFDSYKIFIYSQYQNIDAIIQFFSKDIFSDGIVGQITFKDDVSTFGTNSVNQEGFINLYCHTSRFNDIVNLLRYEKPLVLGFVDETRVGTISTSQGEPPGEQEAV